MFKKLIISSLLMLSGTLYAVDDVTKFMSQSANMKVIREFKGPSGLVGLVIEQNGEYTVMYATADRKTLIAGILMDARGNNLTAEDSLKEVPKQSSTTTTINNLTKAYIIKTGSIKPKVSLYAVFRPTCDMCHMFYNLTKYYPDLEIKWIPIAVNEEEASVIQTIFSNKDTRQALDNWFEKGIVAKNAGLETANKINTVNTTLLKDYNIVATPTLIYTAKDKNVYTKKGLPKVQELNAITGLTNLPIKDLQLKQMVE